MLNYSVRRRRLALDANSRPLLIEEVSISVESSEPTTPSVEQTTDSVVEGIMRGIETLSDRHGSTRLEVLQALAQSIVEIEAEMEAQNTTVAPEGYDDDQHQPHPGPRVYDPDTNGPTTAPFDARGNSRNGRQSRR